MNTGMNSSIQKAFKILSQIAAYPQRSNLSQMSRDLSINKTTLFRFLNTLTSLNIIEKRERGYVLGIKLFELGSKVPAKQLIVERVHPILEKMAEEVNETVNLGELNNQQILYLDKCESKRSLQIHIYVGSYTSLHYTALGKSALSLLPEAEQDSIISKLELIPRTKHTVTDRQTFKAHIKAVKTRGYSLDKEELELGLHCVAVPLSLPELKFIGAISLSGPSVRFTRERMILLAQKLKETVTEIKKTINL